MRSYFLETNNGNTSSKNACIPMKEKDSKEQKAF